MRVNAVALGVSILFCQSAGMLGSLFTQPAIEPWYRNLNKPLITPPSWVFAPAWITLYLLMAIAVYLVWEKRTSDQRVKLAIFVFIGQLILNSAWSFLFFGLRSPWLGLIDIVCLWVAIGACLFLFWRISKVAGLLMMPYLLWVSFAGVLNFYIWRMNPIP